MDAQWNGLSGGVASEGQCLTGTSHCGHHFERSVLASFLCQKEVHIWDPSIPTWQWRRRIHQKLKSQLTWSKPCNSRTKRSHASTWWKKRSGSQRLSLDVLMHTTALCTLTLTHKHTHLKQFLYIHIKHFFEIYVYFSWVDIWPACMSVHCMFTAPMEAGRACQLL